MDHDGNWYATISIDGCNSTREEVTTQGCAAGGALDLWTSPKLRGPGAEWKRIGRMITTNKTPLDSSVTAEFVTSNYFGNVPGDPRGGRTRVVTHNGGHVNSGTPIFYLGLQANGSQFLDTAGKMEFAAPGEIGMLDWAAFKPNNVSGAKGTMALAGGQTPGLLMARTLGGEPNQVATPGRRTLTAWGRASHTFQTLLQDITLGKGSAGEVVLLQQFIPELQMLRSADKSALASSQQFEVVAAIAPPAVPGKVAFTVLGSVRIGVDFAAELVFVDTGAAQPPPKHGGGRASSVHAGPLYMSSRTAPVHVHAIIDHSIVAVIFGNRTSLTVSVTPGEHDAGVQTPAAPGVTMRAWALRTANDNARAVAAGGVGSAPPWLLPKTHNAPACLG